MSKLPFDVDSVLEKLASESVRQSDNVRGRVRELTLKGLQARELSLAGIQQVVRSVASGVNLGAAAGKVDLDKTLADAFAGMDEAVLKAVEASRVAIDRLSSQGADFEQSRMKKSLADLERMEEAFLKSIRQASAGATGRVSERWSGIIERTGVSGTLAGAAVSALMADVGSKLRAQLRSNRESTFKAAHLLSQNFGILASGILIGLAEGLRQSSVAAATAGEASPGHRTSAAAPKPRAARKATKSAAPAVSAAAKKKRKAPAKKAAAKAVGSRRPSKKGG